MNSIELRDDIADYLEQMLQAETVFPVPETLVVRKCVVPVVELEKETGYIVEVYPLSFQSVRDYRDQYTRTYGLRVVVRTTNSSRSPSTIASTEEYFVSFAEWIHLKLMDMPRGETYLLASVGEREAFSREVYAENHMLVAAMDVEVIAYA